jgi:menaquinone-9 beta-reductase
LRHSSEGVELILKYFKKGKLPPLAKKCYSFRVRQVAKFFNSGIENVVF